jgi:hypothetical protein
MVASVAANIQHNYSTECHNVRSEVHTSLKTWKLVSDSQSSSYHQGSAVMWNKIPKTSLTDCKTNNFYYIEGCYFEDGPSQVSLKS